MPDLQYFPFHTLFDKYDFLDVCQVYQHGLPGGPPIAGFDGIEDTLVTLD